MLIGQPMFYFSADGGNGGGTADTSDDLESRLMTAFSNLSARQGGADSAGVLLLQENRDYRSKIKALETELQEAQGRLPAEGAVILAGDDAAAWLAYRALGDPATVQAELNNLNGLRREMLYQQAATANGYKAAVLAKLPGMAELQLEVKEVEADGKKQPAAFVTIGDQERPLNEYVNEQYADFLPALVADNGQQANGSIPFPRQNPGGGQAVKRDMVAEYLDNQRKAQEEKRNPLMKA